MNEPWLASSLNNQLKKLFVIENSLSKAWLLGWLQDYPEYDRLECMNTYQTTIYRPDMSLIYQAFTDILTEKFYF